MSAPNSNSNARQRGQNLRIQDEELGELEPKPTLHTPAVSPGPESSTRRRFQEFSEEISQTLKLQENKEELVRFWDQFTRKGKRKIGVMESLKAILYSSWLNFFLVLIPLAWISNFLGWNDEITFVLCFFAIVPLERLFDWGGEQMAFYLGKELGDLLVITLNNAVEATLAILLLKRCELILLKSTIIGVVILHLLLVPGTAFVTGGARVIQQDLHPHLTELNHSLLTIGVLTLLIPAAFFSAIDSSFSIDGETGAQSVVTDATRHTFLQMSRGLAVLLLVVYVCSRIYLHNPPGEDNALDLAETLHAPVALKEHLARLREEDPEVNQWVCMLMLAICIGLMAATAEYLVESIDFVRGKAGIRQEWFGLILLPIVSFAADGTVAIVYFVRYMFKHFFREPSPPPTLAKGEAIDLSIQFTLFWMPLFVLLGWWTDKPLTLLFETFEVAILIGSCFLVNYVTADSKTNWAEGVAMVSFYCMIALCSWFYPGQDEIKLLSHCGTVADTLAAALNRTLKD
ncbi:hypothetical protein GALMADRAFT_235613 [Galerina marginata CBS 339.88]|uniref:Sodium/calcium exchanger membrane region domain-containing protein n=1 Tax=Galerina marginata (strain CBS 339.88) TaxID=685588 RepID=A0A067TK15_GALM3|nr:hypothetical protein GALMADRAFT_235613 [Galerina marginata CBS 339.88]